MAKELTFCTFIRPCSGFRFNWTTCIYRYKYEEDIPNLSHVCDTSYMQKRSLTRSEDGRIHHNHQSLNFSPWYLHLFRGKHKKHFTRTCLSFKTIQLRGKPFNCVKSHSTAWKAIQMRGNLDWKDFNGGKFFVQLCRVIQLWKAVERYKWVIALTDQYWAVKMVK